MPGPPSRKKYAGFERVILSDVEPLMQRIHVANLRGKTVAVDAYSLISKAANVTGACRELALDISTDLHIRYCLDIVKLLEYYGVAPIFVFHGRLLPLLKWLEKERARIKHEYLEFALATEGNYSYRTSIMYYRKAFDISSAAPQLIKAFIDEGVKFIVAPYDANAQLAFLHKNDLVQAVITDDPSLIPFGCSRIIFKLDIHGRGYELQLSKLSELKPHEGNIFFAGFTKEMIRHVSLLCCCNYAPYGLLSVYDVSSIHKILDSYTKVKDYISSNIDDMDEHELKIFEEADWAYQYQRIYDPVKKEMTHLSNLPDKIPTYFDKDLNFLGPSLSQEVVTRIADGKLNPVTLIPYKDEESNGRKKTKLDNKEIIKTKKAEVFSECQNLHDYILPLQEMDLSEGHWDTSSEGSGEYDSDVAECYEKLR